MSCVWWWFVAQKKFSEFVISWVHWQKCRWQHAIVGCEIKVSVVNSMFSSNVHYCVHKSVHSFCHQCNQSPCSQANVNVNVIKSMLSSHVNFNGNYSVHRSSQSCINQSEQPMSMLKQVNVNVIKSMFPIFSQIVSIMYQSMKSKFKLSSQCQCFQVMSIIMFTNRFNHVSINETKFQVFKPMSMFSSHVNCYLIFSQIVSIMYQSMKSKPKFSSQCQCFQVMSIVL